MFNHLIGKKILLTGVTGQVGRALNKEFADHCELITAARMAADADVVLDLADKDQICSVMDQIKPDIVINPAAYTQVDKAEDEHELAAAINSEAPGVFAELCKKNNSLLIHYSTDYVFNGKGSIPFNENDPVNPINVYGKTKLEGELAIQAVDCDHLIFRTCWVYDAYGRNFLNAILDRARKMDALKVVDDQIGTPTWAGFIAGVTRGVLEQNVVNHKAHDSGNRLYNLRPDGHCSWHDFASYFIDIAKEKESLTVKTIAAVASSEFPSKAKRPCWSVLDNSKLKKEFGLALGDWQTYAARCMEQVYSEKN